MTARFAHSGPRALAAALIPALIPALALALALTGCSSSGGGDTGAGAPAQDGAAPAPGDAVGFEEFPIGDDVDLGPINVAGVYFQPVDMEPAGMGLAAADSSMHIEADISATEEGAKIGYGIGDFIPDLTVDYAITGEDGTEAAAGTFMPMNASDGPHYGANVSLPDAGIYKVVFTIHSPEDQGFLLHTDKETGVEGRFWTTPLVAQWDSFQWSPREW
ncbi:MAG: iron transporter [Bifidobacteriaceae bacterium]|jgi:uncharacterized protein involved in high-affinity Fe2+ transport|nr:iron transporter [Bifidobacteriaceae bacterium]